MQSSAVQQFLPVPQGNKKTFPKNGKVFGAGDRTRTDDLRITNALLYQLSHTSKSRAFAVDLIILSQLFAFVNSYFNFFCKKRKNIS